MPRRQRLILIGMMTAILFAMVACATQPKVSGATAPGFWLGLVHGFLMLFSFIGSLFTDVRIYSYPNAGPWYDFGYLLGAMLFWGGGGASSRRRQA